MASHSPFQLGYLASSAAWAVPASITNATTRVEPRCNMMVLLADRLFDHDRCARERYSALHAAAMKGASGGRRRQIAEGGHHLLIDLALERDDQCRQVRHRLPAPGEKLGFVTVGRMQNVDLALVTGEAYRVPFLALAAVFAAPRLAYDLARNFVRQPPLDLIETLDRADAGFLVELAQRRSPGVFIRIDAALRHLPCMRGVDMLRSVAAAADEDIAGTIEDHDADTRTIGEVWGRHGSDIGHRGSARYPAKRRDQARALDRRACARLPGTTSTVCTRSIPPAQRPSFTCRHEGFKAQTAEALMKPAFGSSRAERAIHGYRYVQPLRP